MNSSLKRHKDLTLPSIEGGFGSMKIKKDPPKGIHTRRIIKVGEDMDILEKIEGSHDRNEEVIQKYARGVNPMVSVSYSNYGNNGGQSVLSRSSATQASLPNRIIDKGAFRPPVDTPRELLPITKFRTTPTSIITNKTKSDYTKRVTRNSSHMREINKNNINIFNVRPTITNIKQTPLPKMKTDKFINKKLIKVSATSGKRTIDNTKQYNRTSGRELNDKLYFDIGTNKGTTTYTKKINTQVDTSKFTQNVNHSDVKTNPKINIDKNDYTRDVELIRNIPVYNVTTNVTKQGNTLDNQSRHYKLQPKISPNQGIVTSGYKPGNLRENSNVKLDNRVTQNNKDIYRLLQSRF